MFTRSILIPSLIVCAVAAPILFSKAKQERQPGESQQEFVQSELDAIGNAWSSGATIVEAGNPTRQPNPSNYLSVPNGQPSLYQGNAGGNFAASSQPGTMLPSFSNQPTGMPQNSMPVYGVSQTTILPGTAEGPDFTAPPLEFLPVTNFEEVFRFDISPDWVISRWPRTSTTPTEDGLHGLRVALVTGTNSWDLHGSLTYFFDERQRLQRITFRGWAGDAKMLINLLTRKFDFQSQPTHWAGFYLAKNLMRTTGGILMQRPSVVYRDNPIQQIAVVMEINDPQGEFVLSDEFHSLIAGSKQSN